MSTAAIIAIAVGGSVLLLGGLAWVINRVNRSFKGQTEAARGRLAEELPRRGWQYSERDDRVVETYNQLYQNHTHPYVLEPFAGVPNATAAKDVITGGHRGRPFLAAVLDTYHHGEYSSQRCVWVRTPAPRPALTVYRMAAMASKINDAIGTGDVKTGNPEFDAKFDIRTKDARFAAEMLSPDLVTYLLGRQDEFRGFMLIGDQLDVFDPISDHRDPAQLVPALDLRCDILDRVPASVWA